MAWRPWEKTATSCFRDFVQVVTSGWIKWEKTIEDDPRVLRMVKQLTQHSGDAGVTQQRHKDNNSMLTMLCGALVRLWSYADTYIGNDDVLDLGPTDVDDIVGIPDFSKMCPLDWLEVIDEHHIKLPDYHTHNGTAAKRRALTQKRMSTYRLRIRDALASPDQDQDQDQDQDRSLQKSFPNLTRGQRTRERARVRERKRQAPDEQSDIEVEKPVWRATRKCPRGWQRGQHLHDWLAEQSFAKALDTEVETAKFRDHTFRTAIVDWDGAWRNWMRRAAELGAGPRDGNGRRKTRREEFDEATYVSDEEAREAGIDF